MRQRPCCDGILYPPPATSEQISFKDAPSNCLSTACVPQNAVSSGCRISLSCEGRIVVGGGGHLGRVPCGALHWLLPSESGLQSGSWNSPITPVRGQTLREGASVRPLRKPILELMGPCSRGLPAKYLSCPRSQETWFFCLCYISQPNLIEHLSESTVTSEDFAHTGCFFTLGLP